MPTFYDVCPLTIQIITFNNCFTQFFPLRLLSFNTRLHCSCCRSVDAPVDVLVDELPLSIRATVMSEGIRMSTCNDKQFIQERNDNVGEGIEMEQTKEIRD
uniref:Uncharacterized protein n=1 Tax=Meloidogyne incognita TaxID=6306 RepID=A0A914N100_MELIC